jgi:hypothetical protein
VVFLGMIGLSSPPLSILDTDSHEYLQYSRALLGTPGGEHTLYRALRTPGYPVILAAGLALFGDLRAAVVWSNIAVGALAYCVLLFALRRSVALPAVSAGYFIFAASNHELLPAMMTEWSAMNALLVVYALVHRTLDTGRVPIALAGVCAAAALIRPVFVFLLVLPPLLAYRTPMRASLLTATTIVPIGAVILHNAARVGIFKLSIAGSVSLFGVCAVLGDASLQEGDTVEEQRFIEEVNAGNRPHAPYSEGSFDAVVRVQRETLSRFGDMGWARVADLMDTYSSRVITEDPVRYLRFLGAGVGEAFADLDSVLLLLLGTTAAISLRRGKGRALLIMIGIHVVHILLVAAVGVVHSRYTLITSEVLWVPILCTFGVRLVSHRKARYSPDTPLMS